MKIALAYDLVDFCQSEDKNLSLTIIFNYLFHRSLDLIFQIIKVPCQNGYLDGETITQLHHVLKKKHFDDYPQL